MHNHDEVGNIGKNDSVCAAEVMWKLAENHKTIYNANLILCCRPQKVRSTAVCMAVRTVQLLLLTKASIDSHHRMKVASNHGLITSKEINGVHQSTQ